MSAKEAFLRVREALELAGVRYAIGGSWASITFGEPRYTRDVDIVADFTTESLDRFLANLKSDFYADGDHARESIRRGASFNIVHMPTVFKFDFFPSSASPIGREEVDRAILFGGSELSDSAVPFVSPEDILLAKLDWFRKGGEVSEQQWRDILGVLRVKGEALDGEYIRHHARALNLTDLLTRARDEVRE